MSCGPCKTNGRTEKTGIAAQTPGTVPPGFFWTDTLVDRIRRQAVRRSECKQTIIVARSRASSVRKRWPLDTGGRAIVRDRVRMVRARHPASKSYSRGSLATSSGITERTPPPADQDRLPARPTCSTRSTSGDARLTVCGRHFRRRRPERWPSRTSSLPAHLERVVTRFDDGQGDGKARRCVRRRDRPDCTRVDAARASARGVRGDARQALLERAGGARRRCCGRLDPGSTRSRAPHC